mmetsp:Transcript_21194/g.42443  ORF Transcript_21194/g.42443 Transcript_21194/m.42443 type:complete len:129 (+) Transcript_21194:208-594(+)
MVRSAFQEGQLFKNPPYIKILTMTVFILSPQLQPIYLSYLSISRYLFENKKTQRLFTKSLKALDAVKEGVLLAFILISSPVRGFLPILSERWFSLKLPNPSKEIFFSCCNLLSGYNQFLIGVEKIITR